MPINMRTSEEMKNIRLENQVSGVVIPLFSSIQDRRQRLMRTIEKLTEAKASAEPLATFLGFQLFYLLPHAVLVSKANQLAGKCTTSVSNVPGPKDPIYFLGHKITRLAFVTPGAANIGVGVSFLSYANQITVAVTTDAAVSTTPSLLLEKFVHEIDHLARLCTTRK